MKKTNTKNSNLTDFQRSNHSVGQNCYHLVWTTKFRINFLKPKHINNLCTALIKGTCFYNKIKLIELEVMSDHVHLFVELPPTMDVSEAFKRIKGRTSKILREKFSWLRKKCPKGHLWTAGKFYRSVGSVQAETIQKYIKYSNRKWKYVKPGSREPFPNAGTSRGATQSFLSDF